MHIPRWIKIKRSKWEVILNKDAFDSEKYDGLCVPYSRKIFVNPDLPGNEVEIIFWHEYLHSLFPSGIVGEKTEEKIVRKLSETLHKSLCDSGLDLMKKKRHQSTKSHKNASKKH